jgi:hypothetical protein
MTQDGSAVDDAQGTAQAALRTVGDAIEPILGERPTMEHVLLVAFLVTGIYMFLGAGEFSAAAAEFPRVMSGLTILLSTLLLARNYLTIVAPILGAIVGLYALYTGGTAFLETGDGLFRVVVGAVVLFVSVVFRTRVGESTQSFVAEPMQVLGEDDLDVPTDDEPDEGEPDEEEGSGAMYTYDIDDPKGPVVTGILCIAYMLVTFVIGMLYATPLFVVAWALWVRMELVKAVALTAISFVSAYLFYAYIQSDIAEGWLTGWEPLPPDALLNLSLGVSASPAAVTDLLLVMFA